MLQERNPALEEPDSFITGSKHMCPFLGMETPSLYFKAICYANILEKIVQTKVHIASVHKICRNMRDL